MSFRCPRPRLAPLASLGSGLALASLALAACAGERASPEKPRAVVGAAVDSSAADSTTTAATRAASGGAVVTRDSTRPAPDVVRALYVNRWASQSSARVRSLVAIADSTEINALVIDMKDEFGLNYVPSNPEWRKNAGSANKLRNLRALLDTLHAHDILPIARLVVFKDSVTARVHPEWTIRGPDGSIWRDHKRLAWVNPYDRALWAYNIGVAEELVRLGFGEIQWDYIRFPEPYKSLPPQVFPGAGSVKKPDLIAAYLKEAKERLNKLGVRSTADIFGLVTTVPGPLEVAQHWERLAPVTDVLLPMVYPNHYPRGSFGIPRPNAEPYKVIHTAINRARQRDEKLGITAKEHVRPWLQAFDLPGIAPKYGPEELKAQMQAVYDAGYDGWVLWNPGSRFETFLPALEKELVSKKKTR
jgi:hypothetical protein